LAEPLKGLGLGLITLAVSGNQQTIVMSEKQRRDQAAAAAAAGSVK